MGITLMKTKSIYQTKSFETTLNTIKQIDLYWFSKLWNVLYLCEPNSTNSWRSQSGLFNGISVSCSLVVPTVRSM